MIAFLRFIIPLLIIVIPLIHYYRKLRKVFNPGSGNNKKDKKKANAFEMVKDEVCGKFILKNNSLEYKKGGVKYYFCSEECRNRFIEADRSRE
jgi:YHS domain-containing protein